MKLFTKMQHFSLTIHITNYVSALIPTRINLLFLYGYIIINKTTNVQSSKIFIDIIE